MKKEEATVSKVVKKHPPKFQETSTPEARNGKKRKTHARTAI